MWAAIIKGVLGWITGDLTGALERAYRAKLEASTDEKRLAAEQRIRLIEARQEIAVQEARDRWSATRIGRLLVVVPFGLWWAAIYLVQIVNPWLGLELSVVDVPPHIHDMALVLVPAILIADAGSVAVRAMRRG